MNQLGLIISFLMCSLYGYATTFSIPTTTLLLDTSSTILSGLQAGDTIALEAGNRDFLILRNLSGSLNNPIVVINKTGLVNISSQHYFGISIRNCQYIHIAGTGSTEEYGIQISGMQGTGIGAGEGTTDLEINNVKINQVDGPGMLIKTNATCDQWHRADFSQMNTRIHHNHISFTGNEGLYLGSSHFPGKEIMCNDTLTLVYDPMLEHVEVYENIVEHTGWDAIQVSSALDANIHNNIIRAYSTGVNSIHKSGVFLGSGFEGLVYNNLIVSGYGNGIVVFANGNTGIFNNQLIETEGDYGIFINTAYTDSSRTGFYILNNLIISPRISGMYLLLAQVDSNAVTIANNAIFTPGFYDYFNDLNHPERAYINTNNFKVLLQTNYTSQNIAFAEYENHQQMNFNLQYTSPLIDAGTNYQFSWFDADFNADDRIQGGAIDIGPFESPFYSSAPASHPNDHFDFFIPVPVTGSSSVLTLKTDQKTTINFEIIDLKGHSDQLLHGILLDQGTSLKSIELSSYPSGVYLLKMQDLENSRYVAKKIIVVH